MVIPPLLLSMIQSGQNEELKKCLEISPELAIQNTEQGISLLQFATYCRNHEAISLLKKYKQELNLFEACSIGNIDYIESILLQDASSIDTHSADGFTALGLASFFGHYNVVELLLLYKANPNIASANSFKVTPLHSACAISNIEIVSLLIQNGADVNAKQQQGVTPLHSAAHNGQKELVQLLIQHGADSLAQMENGKTPADMAIENGFEEIAEIIFQLSKR